MVATIRATRYPHADCIYQDTHSYHAPPPLWYMVEKRRRLHFVNTEFNHLTLEAMSCLLLYMMVYTQYLALPVTKSETRRNVDFFFLHFFMNCHIFQDGFVTSDSVGCLHHVNLRSCPTKDAPHLMEYATELDRKRIKKAWAHS